MSSKALESFISALQSAQSLRATARDKRLRPINYSVRNSFLHAALAAYVASWDSYLNNSVREFCDLIREPLDIDYASAHGRLEGFVAQALRKFNTPNWENSRTLLIECTGYDPINDWNWPRASLNVTQTREYLNEILKVRHSFAHGLAIPNYAWTRSPSGKLGLNDATLQRIERFLLHLVFATDNGLADYGRAHFPNRSVWAK